MLRDFRSKVKKAKVLSLKKKDTKQSSSEEHNREIIYCSDLGNAPLVQTPVSLRIEHSSKLQNISSNSILSSSILDCDSSSILENNTALKDISNEYRPIDNLDLNTGNFQSTKKPSTFNSTFTFDSSVKISENPFDIFNGSLIKIEKPIEEPTKIARQKTTDEFILSGLKRMRSQSNEFKNIRMTGIFNKVTVVSKTELSIDSKKYYKFPFDISVINDESAIFGTIKEEFVIAFSSAYSNYRKFGESFKILINEEVFNFSSTVSCPASCSKLLKSNDIKYTVENGIAKIDQDDTGLVYDVIMNLDIPKGKRAPFILSKFEFENGIVFRTKIQKGPVIRNKECIEYSYILVGPLDTSDFSFDDSVILEYL
ncbi:uncharacterized protein VICG_01052 [Vittaforma corneae ATCC 50505]|uniref:Uncharacterized protein n=1 Tax=Vittaforma corneae (strain ATCC 50505) TaxID=993615 RepID=L2GLV1_VITCO|nr:uncharacterized protein VICG_01052 [Vittaforma corneae ATCC 50505]ELA41868.1 hypothetical protein VICG_01052 [Vittaforma corneae ATCC 50505]